jgi:hypothetical protein
VNRLIRVGLLTLTLSACGGSQDEGPGDSSSASSSPPQTAFGSVEEVTSYLVAIDPFVRKIGSIQGELEQRGVGSSGGAAAANIAAAAETSLKEILADFEELTAPPLLASFHRDTKKLILLRLEASRATIEGFDIQQAGSGDFKARYAEGEEKFQLANSLIGGLNADMQNVTSTLRQSAGTNGERAG